MKLDNAIELAGRHMEAARKCAEKNPAAARMEVRHALEALGLIQPVRFKTATRGLYNCIPINGDVLDKTMGW